MFDSLIHAKKKLPVVCDGPGPVYAVVLPISH